MEGWGSLDGIEPGERPARLLGRHGDESAIDGTHRGIIASSTTCPEATAVSTWKIDPAHTDILFSAKHMMVTTVRGKFDVVEGELELDEAEPTNSRGEIRASAASVSTASPSSSSSLDFAFFFFVGAGADSAGADSAGASS